MKNIRALASLLIVLSGLSVSSVRAADPATVALAKKFEAWLDKDRIITIQNAIRMPSNLPEFTDGPSFDIGGESFNEGQLAIVAHAISWEGDWHSARVWDVLLESPRTHVRCIAAKCLLIIHHVRVHPGRLIGFNCFTEPQTESGRATREEFRKLLAAAKLEHEQSSRRTEQGNH